jgi:hypothetical protein
MSAGRPVADAPAPRTVPQPDEDFSLVLGGPLYQLLRRPHLSDDVLELQRRRVVVLALLAWLPLLLLTTLGGHLLGGVQVPFLYDVEVHVKFLVALPLLVVAELTVHQRMRLVTATFHARNLIPPAGRERLEDAVASAYRLRNSIPAELALLAFVYVVGITVVWRQYMALDVATWYASPAADGSTTLTLAGTWYGYVSLPIFQFLLCRWYFRMVIWARLLWRVSRIELQLMPTHPDRVGGLGFLSNTVFAFIPLILAHGVLLAGVLANQIYHTGAKLTDFRLEILLLAIFLMLIVVGPLLVFGPQLARAKRAGLREYGNLAQRYSRAFERKWLRGSETDDALLGTGDIQSLADLGNSFSVVKEMRLVPVSKEAIFQLAVAAVAPIVPLLLTLMPLEELLRKLIGIVF